MSCSVLQPSYFHIHALWTCWHVCHKHTSAWKACTNCSFRQIRLSKALWLNFPLLHLFDWLIVIPRLITPSVPLNQSVLHAFSHWWMQGMEVCGSIPELVHTPVCMDCWRRPLSATEEVMAVGDIGGYVTLFNLQDNVSEPKRSENRSAHAIVSFIESLHTPHSVGLGHMLLCKTILTCADIFLLACCACIGSLCLPHTHCHEGLVMTSTASSL